MADVPVFPIDEAMLRQFESAVAQEDGWEYEWLTEGVPSFCAALREAWAERDETREDLERANLDNEGMHGTLRLHLERRDEAIRERDALREQVQQLREALLSIRRLALGTHPRDEADMEQRLRQIIRATRPFFEEPQS